MRSYIMKLKAVDNRHAQGLKRQIISNILSLPLYGIARKRNMTQ